MGLSKKEKKHFLLNRGVVEIIEKDSLERKLKSGRKLRVKLGIDPTASFLHLGSAAVLRKLKQFQNMGHQIVLIIGDFTATIGDPAGREEARKPLNRTEIKKNMENYLNQINLILDINKTEICYNSAWYAKKQQNFFYTLISKVTVQQSLERDDFLKRWKAGRPISILELLYPLLQGYDSVQVKADVEIGGTDQKFNLLMGRRVQKIFTQSEQDVLTIDLLIGADGIKKMSKTAGNFIKIDETPDLQFAQIMSLKDELMPLYFELLTDIPDKKISEIKNLIKHRGEGLKKIKSQLAFEIVKSFHGAIAAGTARRNFERVFMKKNIPAGMPVFKLNKSMNLKELLLKSGLALSGAASQRLIEQGAVSLDGQIIKDWRFEIKLTSLKPAVVLKIGKHRFLKIQQ
ncbi:MAG: tyrosine--tRNA ligase [Candidatus Brennerbacteria bacterium]|nr:tyrosine--tRNA ligase [Candidatus Brennerbacteria bacterium]